jgi:putative flavoprotein involved in K+ transport
VQVGDVGDADSFRLTDILVSGVGSDEMRIDCVVVGAGPAGIAMSGALRDRDIEHVVLERDRVGTTWRTQRWDTFRLNTPGYMNDVLGDVTPDSFSTAAEVVTLLEQRATDLPVRQQSPVQSLRRDGDDYVVQTPDEEYRTTGVVIATGNLNVPRVPPIAQQLADDMDQQHASAYRNAEQLPPGGVLVIGSAQSGCQIAEDLVANGRRVYLSTCHVGRLPWRYRGCDTVEWLRDAGFWDQRPEDLEDPAAMRLAQPVVASGGRDLSLQMLSRSGVTLLGHLASIDDGIATFDDSTAANIAFADEFARRIRTTVDNFIERSGATAPPDHDDAAGGQVETTSPDTLDLRDSDINSVVWATGFTGDYSWLHLPILDDAGQPAHVDGATTEPGVWFIGLPWLSRRNSGIFYGFPVDADRIASAISTRVSDRKGA